jgi:hypothetical protein
MYVRACVCEGLFINRREVEGKWRTASGVADARGEFDGSSMPKLFCILKTCEKFALASWTNLSLVGCCLDIRRKAAISHTML